MENASKALIIAGAILLAILIISLGMGVFNQAKEALSGISLDQSKVDAINSQFESYIGNNKKGSQAKTLCKTVKNNNLAADDDETFTITLIYGSGEGVTTATEIDEVINSLSNGKTYKITATYEGPSGTIDTITIEDVK